MKIEWLREDSEFMSVEAVFLLLVPWFMRASISGIDFTIICYRSLTKMPLSGFSLISSLVGGRFFDGIISKSVNSGVT